MPADYINKLARMFQDIKVSNDLNQGFKKEYKNKGDIAGTVFFEQGSPWTATKPSWPYWIAIKKSAKMAARQSRSVD